MKRQWLNKKAERQGPQKITGIPSKGKMNEQNYTDICWSIHQHWYCSYHRKSLRWRKKNDTLNSINPSNIPATSTTFIHHLLPCCSLWSSGQHLIGKKLLYLHKSRVFFFFLFFSFYLFSFFLFCFEADKMFHVIVALCALLDLQGSCTGSQSVQGWLCTACTPNSPHTGHHTLQCCTLSPTKSGNSSPH